MNCSQCLPCCNASSLWLCSGVFRVFFFFSSRRRHTRFKCDWSSDVCSSDLYPGRYRGHRLESMLEMRENMDQLVTFLQRFDKPTIAAVNGPAVAGGLTLALSCDFRIAAESAKLGDTSLKFGLIPDEGGAYLLPRVMGQERALKMSPFSEGYPARQAK